MTHLSLVSERGAGTGDTMWREAWKLYDEYLRAAGRSSLTIRLHRHYLNQLREGYGDPWRIKFADLVQMLGRESWGPESRKSARTVYVGFYRWAAASGFIAQSPAISLPAIRVNAGAPRPTPEVIAQSVMHDIDQRTAFMAMLAGYCGLRASEVSRVHELDYDRALQLLVIHGKGRKERVVPIVQADLIVCLESVSGWAFPGRTEGHLSAGHVTKILSRAMPGIWTAHTLRHRAGTKAYRGTRDVLAVARMLGHARTETTQRYVQMDDEAVRAAMVAASLTGVTPPASNAA